MKSTPKFLALVLLTASLCLAPSAFGRASVNGKVGGSFFLSQTATSALVLTLGPGADAWGDRGDKGCGERRDRRRGGNCSQVPEGGTTFVYLTLAGLCCLATAIFTIRRRARLPETS